MFWGITWWARRHTNKTTQFNPRGFVRVQKQKTGNLVFWRCHNQFWFDKITPAFELNVFQVSRGYKLLKIATLENPKFDSKGNCKISLCCTLIWRLFVLKLFLVDLFVDWRLPECWFWGVLGRHYILRQLGGSVYILENKAKNAEWGPFFTKNQIFSMFRLLFKSFSSKRRCCLCCMEVNEVQKVILVAK